MHHGQAEPRPLAGPLTQGVADHRRGIGRAAFAGARHAHRIIARRKGRARAAAPRRATPQAPRPCTVLLVDDDALISMATCEMLKDLGHRVVEANSGSKALEILRAGTRVDLVVSDEAMPNMGGTQLAAAIHASWPGLPIILATGYAELPKGSELGLPLLRKPYSQQDLAGAIARAIGARAARTS